MSQNQEVRIWLKLKMCLHRNYGGQWPAWIYNHPRERLLNIVSSIIRNSGEGNQIELSLFGKCLQD